MDTTGPEVRRGSPNMCGEPASQSRCRRHRSTRRSQTHGSRAVRGGLGQAGPNPVIRLRRIGRSAGGTGVRPNPTSGMATAAKSWAPRLGAADLAVRPLLIDKNSPRAAPRQMHANNCLRCRPEVAATGQRLVMGASGSDWTGFRSSCADFGHRADVGGPDPILRIKWGPPKPAPRPNRRAKNGISSIQIRAMSAHSRAGLRMSKLRAGPGRSL